MAKKTIKQEALEHYDRMIEWASAKRSDAKKDYKEMIFELGEYWGDRDCVYCREYLDIEGTSCEDCQLYGTKKDCSIIENCCDGAYWRMVSTETWGDWVREAKKVRKYIDKNG